MADHPNLVSARQGYQAFADGDLARVSELLDDHVVWHVGGNNTLTGDYEGKEAVLSFFGLMDVNMSWGLMINIAQSQGYLLSGTRYWWLLIPAGAAITLLCSAFYLVGRALDEVVNPRLRQR